MPDTPDRETPERGLWNDVWYQFRHHKGAMAGTVIFALIALAVVFGPMIHAVDPTHIDVKARNSWPTLAHPMGTDNLGRDTFAGILQGGRISLAVGITAMGLALVLGTLVGVLAGYFRRVDGLLMRVTDLFSRCRCCRSSWWSSCCFAIPCARPSGRRRGSSC